MNDQFERDLQDGNPTYLYTADTLDVDTAASMSADEFTAEMQRLRDRAAIARRINSRRPAHRRALKSGAVRLVLRALRYDEPTLNDLGADDVPPLWNHPNRNRWQAQSRRAVR
jgi:hypothetical protein